MSRMPARRGAPIRVVSRIVFNWSNYERGARGLVETKTFLQDKGRVDGERQVEDVISKKQAEDVDKSSGHSSKPKVTGPGVPPCESSEEPEAKEDRQGRN